MRKVLIIASLLAAFATPVAAQKIIQVVPLGTPVPPQTQKQQLDLVRQQLNACTAMQDKNARITCLRATGFGRPSDQVIADCIRNLPQIGMTMAQFENSCWRRMPSEGSDRITTTAGVLEQRNYMGYRYRFYFTNGILTAIQD